MAKSIAEYSNAELEAIANKQPDLSSMSDTDLQKIAGTPERVPPTFGQTLTLLDIIRNIGLNRVNEAQNRGMIPGLLPEGTTANLLDKITGPVPSGENLSDLPSRWVLQAQRMLPEMIGGAVERPISTVKGLVTTIPEQGWDVLRATPLNPSLSSQAEAQKKIVENLPGYLATAVGFAVPFLKGKPVPIESVPTETLTKIAKQEPIVPEQAPTVAPDQPISLMRPEDVPRETPVPETVPTVPKKAKIPSRPKQEGVKPARETIVPSNDTNIGVNASGEQLYERQDGSRYRIRLDRSDRPHGYPDFGGDLAPSQSTPDVTKPQQMSTSAEVPSQPKQPWEMTMAEFRRNYEKIGYLDNNSPITVPVQWLRDKARLRAPLGNNAVDLRTRGNMTQFGQEGFPALKQSLQDEGLKNSVSINFDENGRIAIVDGTHRLLALDELGVTNVRVNVTPSVVDSPAKLRSFHKLVVESARSDGKPVPASVLSDYPDLAAKYGGAETPTEPTVPKTEPVGQVSETPVISEKSAGITPSAIVAAFKKLFGTVDASQGKKLVNPVGTPEIVLRGRGIVEPFQEAKPLYEAKRLELSKRLGDLVAEEKKNPVADNKLFDKLNDPEAELSGNQAGVRQYLDDLLNEVNKHRIARKQDPIPYRKGYITHIIDQVNELSTVFRDVALPKKLKFAFEKREGATNYKTSAVDALTTYTDAALKDIYYGDALHKAIPNVDKLNRYGERPVVEKRVVTNADGTTTNLHFYNLHDAPFFSERNYADNFIKRQLGWPTQAEKAVTGITGLSHIAQRKITQWPTQLVYKALLGGAVDTALKNFTQGVNTIAESGYAPAIRGYARLATKTGITLVRNEHLLEEFQPLLQGGERSLTKGVLKAFDDNVLGGPMKFSEFVNRGAQFHAVFDDLIKKGVPIEKAELQARAAVRKTQFAYGKIDTSPHLQGAYVRPLFQFGSFPIKQAELMYQWAKEGKTGQGKLLRYFGTTGALIVGGIYAGVSLNNVFFNPVKMVDPNSKEGVKLPGSDKRIAPASLSEILTTGFAPSGPPPIVKAVQNVKALATSHDPYEIAGAKKQLATMFIPGGRYGNKVYEVVKELGGEPVKDARGRIIRKPSVADALTKLVGLKTTDAEVSAAKKQQIIEVEQYYNQQRQRLIDAVLSKDTKTRDDIINEMRSKYPALLLHLAQSFGEGVQSEAKNKAMTQEQRFYQANQLRRIIAASLQAGTK